jgi:hypothetical protein
MTTVASPTLSPTWLTMTPDRYADTAILRSLLGVGVVLAGGMLSEFGTTRPGSPTPAADATTAGTAPITKASGKGRAVLMRRVRNTRLFDSCKDGSFSTNVLDGDEAASRSKNATDFCQPATPSPRSAMPDRLPKWL